MTVTYRAVWAERFPDWREVLLETPVPDLPDPTVGRTDPRCVARRHRSRAAWELDGCVCADEVLRGEIRRRNAESKRRNRRGRLRAGVPSLRGVDGLTAMALADGYRMPAAGKPEHRLAALLMARRGLTGREIAYRLDLSDRTVWRYLASGRRLSLRRWL